MGDGTRTDPDTSCTFISFLLYVYSNKKASLTQIGLAAPITTITGIILNVC